MSLKDVVFSLDLCVLFEQATLIIYLNVKKMHLGSIFVADFSIILRPHVTALFFISQKITH
jgi:hypothetical protein